MSKRALKRRVTNVLVKRDALTRVIDAYTTAMYDQGTGGPLRSGIEARIVELTKMRDELQAHAERLASDVPGNKHTFSGRWLHHGILPF